MSGVEDWFTLQDFHQKLAEGRNIIVIHNHPNNSGASPADLSAAAWLDAEYMIIVNRDGTVHRHQKIGDALVELEPLHNPDFAAPADPVETVLHSIAYAIQSLLEFGNPAEMVMRQGKTNEDEYTINTDSRLVSEFLLNPAAIVFLEDVANEYEVEDPLLHNAMVYTIIYRELSAPHSLENADEPAYQHSWDRFKVFMHLPWYFGVQIEQLKGGPSLGIGALRQDAALKIENDAQQLGMKLYFPALEFDLETNLDEIPFSRGIHNIERYAGSDVIAVKQALQVIPPSNVEHGAWQVELPQIAAGSDLRKSYEPTLGYIAAEVAIAMQTPEYQELQTEDERIRFLIAYHANRSANPGEHLYTGELSSDTRREIKWLRDFEALIDEVRTEIQADLQSE